MVKRSVIITTIVGLVLTIVFAPKAFSQVTFEYYALKKYHKWGIITGPVLYNRAKLEPQYGEYTFENRPIWGFNAGFDYDFHPANKWSFITGLIVALEPVYNIKYSFKEEDIYPQFKGGDVDKAKMYAMTSFSAPLLIRLNLQIGDKMFMNFRTGLKVMYFPSGFASFSLTYHNKDNTEAREVFGLKAESPDNWIQGSFVIGTGVSYALKKILIKANLVYVMNFQNTMEGEYLFDNLFVSPRSYGFYKLSGNYIGLLFTINLAKRQKNGKRTSISPSR